MSLSVPPELIADLCRVALACADAARPETLRHFRAPALAADNKQAGGFDPVTEGDRAAERAMREVLARLRPDDAILGEEYGASAGSTGVTWVLDPIDGTRAYLAGAPTWGTLVAAGDGAAPLVGLIDQPHTDERFFGAPGEAWLDHAGSRRDLATRDTARIEDAILLTTFPEIGSPEDRAAFSRVSERARLTRYGLDCYAYGLLAAGHVDLVIEAGLQAYDIQGPMAVVQAAGGIVTTWDGGKAGRGGRIIAAANADLHAAALELLGRI
ncbi:inositol monophosphatase family protein [Palleronia sediminis]|uniref:Inositol monophosphatase family protein n=1 Tax=Palleronia sediminis TaxID=2547833 RepID=A0A4V3B8L3_9RHOB|nr:inositol monophosphatase family protein [Palleronia sediminis]TDL75979.1 inositol monophosphatase family protein [Palleronia sediminis]